MLHGIVAASLKDVVEPDDVALNIHIGILNAVAHARLCGQINHGVKLILPEQPLDELPVGNASLHELVVDASRHGLVQLPQTLFLERRVIVVVEVINPHYGAPGHLPEKPLHQVGSNKTGRTSNKYCFHLFFQLNCLIVYLLSCFGAVGLNNSMDEQKARN